MYESIQGLGMLTSQCEWSSMDVKNQVLSISVPLQKHKNTIQYNTIQYNYRIMFNSSVPADVRLVFEQVFLKSLSCNREVKS